MGIAAIDHVQVAAPPGCEPEARRFYGELLGLAEIPKPEELRGRGGVWFEIGRQQLHIGVEENFAPAQKAHPALAVERGTLDELAAKLTEAESPVTWDNSLPNTRRLYTKDPWSNRIELLEP